MMRNSKKQHKPLIVLVFEGRNKTERTYFGNFKNRDNGYILKLENSESADVKSMIKKAKEKYAEYDMSKSRGDRIFCLIDVDLNQKTLDSIEKFRKMKSNSMIEIVISNPCFEIWFMYYFIANPPVISSSQKVKSEMRRYVPNYTEAYDVYKCCNLKEKNNIAIMNSKKKNMNYDLHIEQKDKNPYTEVGDLVKVLLEMDD